MSVVLLSGGLDSLVMLATYEKRDALCVTFDYGQRHIKEVDHARKIAAKYGREHAVIRLRGVFPPCPLTREGALPTGAPHDDPVQSATVVPNRNAVMISIAAAWAAMHDDRSVLIGCHASDHAVYQDCRPKFMAATAAAIAAGCGASLKAPFLHKSRAEVVEIGRQAGVDFSLAWSCYTGGDEPCGLCGACIERGGAGA